MNRIKITIFFSVMIFLLTACGGSGTSKAEYTIEMTEFGYSPSVLEVSVGQEVTLHLINKGALAHELMVGREVVVHDGQPANYEHNMFEHVQPEVMMAEMDHEAGGDEHHMEVEDQHMDEHSSMDHGFMVSLSSGDPDQETTLTFTVTEEMVGEWEIGCFLDGGSHYHSGMVGKLIVNP